MGNSLITILLFSFFLIGCGKKNETGEYSPGQISNKRTIQFDENDYDGDYIPNNEDLRPYIADFPSLNKVLAISHDGISLKASIALENSSIDLKEKLKRAFPFKSFKFSPNELLKVQLTQSEPHDYIGDFEIENTAGISNLSLTIQGFDSKELSFEKVSSRLKVPLSQISKNRKKPIFIKINDFSFRQEGKKLKYSNLLEKLDSSTYKLNIIKENEYKTFRVSTYLTIEEALEHLGLKEIKEKFKNSHRALKHMPLEVISNDLTFWRLVNTNSQEIADKIPAGSSVSIINISKKKLASKIFIKRDLKLENPGDFKKIIFSNPVSLDLDFKFIITEKILKRKKLKCFSIGEPCFYYENKIATRKSPLNQRDILKYFRITLNGSLQKLEDLKKLNLRDSTKQELLIELKENKSKSFKVGLVGGPGSNGDKAVFAEGKKVKLIHKNKTFNSHFSLQVTGNSSSIK